MPKPKVYQPTIYMKIKTEDGAALESKGHVSAEQAYAVHIFNWLFDVPQSNPPSEFLTALGVFKEACAKHRKSLG